MPMTLKEYAANMHQICFGQTVPSLYRASPLLIYRDLVRGNVEKILKESYPILFALLDAGQSCDLIDSFLQQGITSRYYRDIQFEFQKYFEQQSPFCRVEWICECVTYEAGIHELIAHPMNSLKIQPVDAELELSNLVVVLNPDIRIFSFTYPVHEFESAKTAVELAPKQTFMVIYRKQNWQVRELILSEPEFNFLNSLLSGQQNLGAIIKKNMSETFKEAHMLACLKSWVDKGIVTGFS